MYLSAVKFLKDKGPFNAGDIITFCDGFCRVRGPQGVGKTTLMLSIVQAIMDNDDTIERIYANSTITTNLSGGVLYVGFDGKVIGDIDPSKMEEIKDMAVDGNLSEMYSYICDNVDNSLVILDEFTDRLNYLQANCTYKLTRRCLSSYRGKNTSRHNQVLHCSATHETPYEGCLSVGNKAWVHGKYYMYARSLSKLTKPLIDFRDDGYVVMVDINGTGISTSPCVNTKGYMMLAGGGELVAELTNAFVYKSKSSAVSSIDAIVNKSYGPYYRYYIGGPKLLGRELKGLSISRFKIITVKELADELLYR